MTARAYIGLGSNVDPESNIPDSLEALGKRVKIVAVSTFYRTKPLRRPHDPPFYNGAVGIETVIAPRELKYDILRSIEDRLGRRRDEGSYAPRPIDLDILVYGNLVINSEKLVIPDPEIYEREFVAVPILELEPGLVLPDTGRSIVEVARSLRTGSMEPLQEFTDALKVRLAEG